MRCSAPNHVDRVIVLEDDCIVNFKPVALLTQAIAKLLQYGDFLFLI